MMTERIGPVPGMPAPRPVVPVSRDFSSVAGVQSFRAGTPLSGAHAAAESPYAAERAARRRAGANWPNVRPSRAQPWSDIPGYF